MTARYEDPGTPPQDTGPPDQVETDPAALNSSEDLDEDRLHVDPQEKGVEPPERWSAADRAEMSPYEEGQDPDIEQRLSEERADVPAPEPPERAIGETPEGELDASIDDVTGDVEPIVADEPVPEAPSASTRRGQAADEAGGSVADALRDPGEPG